MGEAQYASVVEAATPAMMTTLLPADRFKLDSATAGLMVVLGEFAGNYGAGMIR